MKLVAVPDGAVDRFDRALWLTLLFDLSWGAPVAPPPTPLDRTWTIAFDNRTLPIALEDRVLVIERENRVWAI